MSLFEESMRLGEILQELCLNPLSMGAIAVARNLGVIRTRVERLSEGVAGIASGTRFQHDPAAYLDEHAGQLRHGCDVQKG